MTFSRHFSIELNHQSGNIYLIIKFGQNKAWNIGSIFSNSNVIKSTHRIGTLIRILAYEWNRRIGRVSEIAVRERSLRIFKAIEEGQRVNTADIHIGGYDSMVLVDIGKSIRGYSTHRDSVYRRIRQNPAVCIIDVNHQRIACIHNIKAICPVGLHQMGIMERVSHIIQQRGSQGIDIGEIDSDLAKSTSGINLKRCYTFAETAFIIQSNTIQCHLVHPIVDIGSNNKGNIVRTATRNREGILIESGMYLSIRARCHGSCYDSLRINGNGRINRKVCSVCCTCDGIGRSGSGRNHNRIRALTCGPEITAKTKSS